MADFLRFEDAYDLLKVDANVDEGTTTTFIPAEVNVLKVREIDDAVVYLFVKGDDAGNTGNCDFILQHSPTGEDNDWFDLPTKSVAMNGATEIRTSDASLGLDLSGEAFIRLGRVINNDATADHSVNVNAHVDFGKRTN